MYDDELYLFRLSNGELIIASSMTRSDIGFSVIRPHSIMEETDKDGNPTRVVLRPSIPHLNSKPVYINNSMVIMYTKAPDNIRDGYMQALSGNPVEVDPLAASLPLS